jgi:7-cyano-7-deazaguanine synthase
MNNEVVVSVSGGMDSTGLLIRLLSEGRKVNALSFYYGQKHSVELQRLEQNIMYLKEKNLIVEHKVIDLSSVMGLFHSALTSKDCNVPEGHYADENMKQTVVPNRNAIFSSLVYGYALSIATKNSSNIDIALGVHSGDHEIYPDCRPEFYDAIYKAFSIGNWESEKVNYYLPYMNENKYFILKDSINNCNKLGLDFNTIFTNTNTCYNPNDRGESCGRCGSCTERLEAFGLLSIKDPVSYSI